VNRHPPRDVVILLASLSCPWCCSADGQMSDGPPWTVDHFHDELADGSPCPVLTNDADELVYLDQLDQRVTERGGTLPQYFADPLVRPASRSAP
jgi:hypothetical protein